MRRIDGETRLLGLLGKNTHYTLSPAIHNAAIAELGLNQVYVNFDLEAEKLENFLSVFYSLGGVGLNVTQPYKEVIAPLVDSGSLTSVNALVRNSTGGWTGHSTDGQGFIRGLRQSKIFIEEIQDIVIFGAGGAASAIIQACKSLNSTALKNIFIIARNQKHAATMTNLFGNSNYKIHFVQWQPELFSAISAQLSSNSLIIQATSAPLKGDRLETFVDGIQHYQGHFVDLIYSKPSALYFAALNRGLKTQDGVPMLIEQARISQELWWGKAASYESIYRALKSAGAFSQDLPAS